MNDAMLRLTEVRKEFRYLNPDPNSNDNDMWVAYLLGLLGRNAGRFGAKRRRITALDGVSLEVRRGEFFGILGPNGAGKSTLVKILSTILKPTSGGIEVDGHDAVRHPALARASLSVIPASGSLTLDSYLTVAQNFAFWGRLYGVPKGEIDVRIAAALEAVGMASWVNEQPGTLSSGMRQRLAIAKGLLVRAPLFVLDEPTAYVDPLGSADIQDFIRNELNRGGGQTVIITTHDMAEAEHLCDRVALIAEGRVVACDRPSRLVRTLDGRVIAIEIDRQIESAMSLLRASDIIRRVVDLPNGDGGGELRIMLRDSTDAGAPEALLEGNGIPVAKRSPAKATLEDVFLDHTGRRLHESA